MSSLLFALITNPLAAFSILSQVYTHSFADLGIGVVYVFVYSAIGLLMVYLAFKLIDIMTPGRLSKQIADEKHLPLAVIAGCAIIGISIIIAASIAG
jgi:putative membrane protein